MTTITRFENGIAVNVYKKRNGILLNIDSANRYRNSLRAYYERTYPDLKVDFVINNGERSEPSTETVLPIENCTTNEQPSVVDVLFSPLGDYRGSAMGLSEQQRIGVLDCGYTIMSVPTDQIAQYVS